MDIWIDERTDGLINGHLKLRNYSIKPSYKASLKEQLNKINYLQDVFTSYQKKILLKNIGREKSVQLP